MKDQNLSAAWADQIPDEQWSVYRRVIEAVQERGVRFALGGAFALATYTGYWRNTKDLDLFIVPQDRDAMIEVLTAAGLEDLFDREAYDRGWIYRGCEGETIVDAIWSMANYRAEVDEAWLTRGPTVTIRDLTVPIVAAEELIWAKIYILQRPRCDWTDILNLIYALADRLDWEHLRERMGEDVPLLLGVLSVFAWLCPGRARALPDWRWERLSPPEPPLDAPDVDHRRVNLLDTRPWFVPTIEEQA